MKFGIISDVHANLPALEAVLDDGLRFGIESWICLGDIVGYYYWPNECVDLVRRHCEYVISGNHEKMIIEAIDNASNREYLLKRYGSGSAFTAKELSMENRSWVRNLPDNYLIKCIDIDIQMCHGSPRNYDEYIYPDCSESILDCIVEDTADVLLMGHTHYPFVKKHKQVILCNPGSVGQPRNYQPGAHWCIFNSDSRVIQHRVVEYDISNVIALCKTRDPEMSYLSDVLVRSEKKL